MFVYIYRQYGVTWG